MIVTGPLPHTLHVRYAGRSATSQIFFDSREDMKVARGQIWRIGVMINGGDVLLGPVVLRDSAV